MEGVGDSFLDLIHFLCFLCTFPFRLLDFWFIRDINILLNVFIFNVSFLSSFL